MPPIGSSGLYPLGFSFIFYRCWVVKRSGGTLRPLAGAEVSRRLCWFGASIGEHTGLASMEMGLACHFTCSFAPLVATPAARRRC